MLPGDRSWCLLRGLWEIEFFGVKNARGLSGEEAMLVWIDSCEEQEINVFFLQKPRRVRWAAASGASAGKEGAGSTA